MDIPPPPRSPSTTDRAFLGSVIGIVGLSVGLHVLGATAFTHSLWGADFYAFFHPRYLIVASTALLVLCGLAILFSQSRLALIDPLPLWRRRSIRVASVALGAAGLWVLRSRSAYLGDGTILTSSLVDGQAFHAREPLTMLLQQGLYRFAGWLFRTHAPERIAEDAVALGSVGAGIIFIVVACRLADELIRLRQPDIDEPPRAALPAVLVTSIVLTQGYIQLFCGYIENYAYYALGVVLYLWLSLRFLRGRGALLLPALSLVVAIAFHLASAILLPSFVVLCVWGVMKPDRRVGVVRDVSVAGVFFVIIHFALASWHENYSLIGALLEATGFAVARQQEQVSLLSLVHVRDVVNQQLLIGPLGIVLFVTAAAVACRAARRITGIFLVVAAVSHVGPAWLVGDSIARDWDLFAPAGILFTAAGLGLFLLRARGRRAVVPGLFCALLLSLYHTLPWVLVNASPERGLARLKTLPLGFGQTEVLVSQWYRSYGFDEQRYAWLVTALAINPRNTNAHHLLGVYYSERGDWESAAVSFGRAVTVRPDKVLFRQLLADALIRSGRDADALPHLEFELAHNPGDTRRWMIYGEALRNCGRPEDAAAAFERVLSVYLPLAKEEPARYEIQLACGWLLHSLGRSEEALAYLEQALRIRPDSDSAWCLLGYAERSLGRTDKAVARFRRCLDLNPDHPDRPDIESWLHDRPR